MAEKSKHEQRRSKSMAALGVVFEQQTAEWNLRPQLLLGHEGSVGPLGCLLSGNRTLSEV
jgi:hypothetical protein